MDGVTSFDVWAVDQGRLIGRIEKFDIFAQDDGRKYPISACLCSKLDIEVSSKRSPIRFHSKLASKKTLGGNNVCI